MKAHRLSAFFVAQKWGAPLGGLEIASLFAKVGADVGDFEKGMKKVRDDMSLAEKGMSGLQSAVGTGLKMAAGVGIAAVGALATGIGYAVTKAADMEQGVQDIAAAMQLGAEDTAALKDLIMDLGLDPKLKVTATEAAQAIGVLGTAGLTMDEIMGGAARSTVLLANSTGADFANAGAIATDVMAQFNIKAADMAAAVDQITGVTVASKFDINDYGLALAQAGGVAGSVGVSFEDFNATIASISPLFASGSEAGTSFKTLLTTLQPKSDEAAEAMKALGLITADGSNQFFTASGEMKSMSDIAGILQTAFGGLSEAQRIEQASTIFGTDAMRAAFGLITAGTPGILDMKKIIGDTSAEEAAATRMDSLRGAWEIFTGVVDTLTLGIGDKFLPIARVLVEWLSSLAQTYGPPVIDWFGQFAEQVAIGVDWLAKIVETGTLFNEKFAALPKPIQDVVTGISNLVTTIGDFLKPIADAIGSVIKWQDVLMAVGAVILSIAVPAIVGFLVAAAPVIAIFAALVAASAVLRAAWTGDWSDINNFVTKTLPKFVATMMEWGAAAWEWLKDAIPVALEWVGKWGAALWKWVTDNTPTWIKNLVKWADAAWDWIVGATTTAVTEIGKWGKALWKWVTDNAPEWLKKLGAWGKAAWEWIVDVVPDVLVELGKWGAAIFKWLVDHLPDFLATVLGWATALVNWIADVIPDAINNLADFVKGLREKGDGDGLNSFVEMALGWATALWKWITEELIPAVGPAWLSFMGAMGNYGLQLLTALGNLALQLGITLWQWIVDITPTAVTKLGEWGSALWNWISTNMPTWVQNLAKWASAAWQWIVDASGPALTELGKWGAALWGWVTDNAPSWATELGKWAAIAWEWIRDTAIPEATTKLAEWGAALWDWVKENAPSWKEKLAEWGAMAWQWIVDVAIPEAKTKLAEWGAALWNWVKENAPSWKEKLGEWAKAAYEWITTTAIPMAKQKLGEWGAALKQWVVDNVQGWIDKFKQAGKDIIDGLWSGIQSAWDTITRPLKALWDMLPQGLRDALGAHSPSRVFASIGGDIMFGLRDGINNNAAAVTDAMGLIYDSVTGQATRMTQSIISAADQGRAAWEAARIAIINTPPPTFQAPAGGVPASQLSGSNAPAAGGTTTSIPATMSAYAAELQAFNQTLARSALISEVGLSAGSNALTDLWHFAQQTGQLLNVPGGDGIGAAAQSAIGVLQTDTGGQRVDAILAAVQALVQAIKERGLGTAINVTAAPLDSTDNRVELEQLVTYLNALYA